MFDFIEGKVVALDPGSVTVSAGGLGIRARITVNCYKRIKGSTNVMLHLYARVSNEEVQYFGFVDTDERDVFLQMVNSVQQLGPGKALAILSNMTPGEFESAVAAENVGALEKIKGIGSKIAARIVMELKGKIVPSQKAESQSDESTTAIKGLVTLGYTATDARHAVLQVIKKSPNKSVEDIIVDALKVIQK